MLDEGVATGEVDDDELVDETQEKTRPPRDYTALKRALENGVGIATFAAFIVVFAAAVVGNWQRSQNVDPEYTADIVFRTIRFGGAYYQNGIHNKGPLEPFVYQVASWITTRDGFWYGISFFIALSALIIAFAAMRTTQSFGGPRNLGLAAGVVIFVHLTFSPSDYAGVLYARNMTTPLLAAAWTIMLWDRAWINRRRALIAAIVSGAFLGFAVQTLTTTAFAATAVSLTTLAMVRLRRPRSEYARLDVAFIGAGAVAFLSAPVWYLVRGQWTEFFSGWWTYATFMSTGTGRSLGSQFALGWDTFYAYYQHRPAAALAILAFVCTAGLDWQRAGRRQRYLYLGLAGWWAGAWIELILSQRYSSHYFVVSTVPTALMIAALAGRVYSAVATQRGHVAGSFAWPLIALVLSVYFFGPKQFTDSMQDLSTFTSVHEHAVQVAAAQSGDIRERRAVLDLVSKEWDPVLVWTNDPWPYLDVHRVSATRFIWKSFLTGEIYLGRTSPSYVLPHSWDWFRKDLAQSKPAAYFKSNGGDIPVGSPFMQTVQQDFTTVYPADTSPVFYRNDVAAEILNPSTPNAWQQPSAPSRSDSGWRAEAGRLSYRESGGRDSDWQPIASDSCFALTGRVSSDGSAGGLVFHFDDNASTNKAESVNLDFNGDHVSSGSPAVEYHRLPSGITTDGRTPTPFTLVVGRRAAALIVNGQIRAAVTLPKSVKVSLESQHGILDVIDMRVGAPPSITGC